MRNSSGRGFRKLRVFLLSNQRYEGTLGEDGSWPANTLWADNVATFGQQITSELKLDETDFAPSLQNANYLTEFEDRSFPRPGTDEIYFRPSADQSTKERPPIVRTRKVTKYWPGPPSGWLSASMVDVLKVAVPVAFVLAIYWRLRRRTIARSREANQNRPV